MRTTTPFAATDLCELSLALTNQADGRLRQGLVWVSNNSVGGRRIEATAEPAEIVNDDFGGRWMGYDPATVVEVEFTSASSGAVLFWKDGILAFHEYKKPSAYGRIFWGYADKNSPEYLRWYFGFTFRDEQNPPEWPGADHALTMLRESAERHGALAASENAPPWERELAEVKRAPRPPRGPRPTRPNVIRAF